MRVEIEGFSKSADKETEHPRWADRDERRVRASREWIPRSYSVVQSWISVVGTLESEEKSFLRYSERGTEGGGERDGSRDGGGVKLENSREISDE